MHSGICAIQKEPQTHHSHSIPKRIPESTGQDTCSAFRQAFRNTPPSASKAQRTQSPRLLTWSKSNFYTAEIMKTRHAGVGGGGENVEIKWMRPLILRSISLYAQEEKCYHQLDHMIHMMIFLEGGGSFIISSKTSPIQ